MTVNADIPRAVTDVYRLRAIKQPRYKGPAIFSGMRRRFTLAVTVSGSGSTRRWGVGAGTGGGVVCGRLIPPPLLGSTKNG